MFTRNGITGSTIDFSRDFDFGNELGYEIRYTYKSENKRHKIVADWAETNWERTRTLSRSFTFLGQTYVANLDATAGLTLREFRAMYSYRWGTEKFRIGPMADMGVISTRLNITGTTNQGTRSGEVTTTKFAATLGYDLDYDPNSKINLFHNLGAIVFQGEHLFHTEGGVKYFPTRNFGITGGYRFQRYKLEDGSDFITVRNNGPFAGGILRF